MRVFFDSSAFAKRYVAESGSDEVVRWCEGATVLALSVIALPELVSAFCRLRREGRLSDLQYGELKGALLADIDDALICDTTAEVVALSIDALEAAPLRAMDAIHIAAALACRADVFVSADARQCEAAGRLGLQVARV